MTQIVLKKYSNYFLLAIFLLMIYISFLVIKPFMIAVFTSLILSYMFYPVYRRVLRITKNKNLTSILIITLIILIVLTPLVFLANSLFHESVNIYSYVKGLDMSIISDKYGIDLDLYISNVFQMGSKFFVDLASNFLISIPGKLLQIFVIMFLMFYLFKEGETLLKKSIELIPLTNKYKEKFILETKEISHAVVYGLIITGLIQGILGAIGFWIFKVPNPILWGFVMLILSILPIVGPPIVWIPAVIWSILNGHNGIGIAILIYGSLMSILDSILRPKIIGDRAKVHPIIILLGILGGIKFFGIIGIILGPLLLSFLISILKLNRVVNLDN